MAEIQNETRSGKPNRAKKRKSPAVDMTAMVDVAFLLLTFFVLTATISDESIIETVLPPACEGEDCFTKLNEEKILTLLVDDEQLFFYNGSKLELHPTDFSSNGLRKVLLSHLTKYPQCRNEVKDENCWDPIVMVKATEDSAYGDLINVLDELMITQAPKYVIADITQKEKEKLTQ